MTMHDKNKPKKLLIYIFSFLGCKKNLSRKNFAFQPYKKIYMIKTRAMNWWKKKLYGNIYDDV
jgi:hypothetical protein